MRYLTLRSEYAESPVRDDFVGSVVPEEAGLSDSLADLIRCWNGKYKRIIPLGPEERAEAEIQGLIDDLDREGLSLVAAISVELDDVKVRYYSEGRLEYLWPAGPD